MNSILENPAQKWALVATGASFLLYFGKKYFNGATCNIKKDLSGKIVVITGANTGIGKYTATILAGLGATVIIGCRSIERGQKALEEIKKDANSDKVEFIQLDLADTQSIRSFAKEFNSRYNRLDILINNAGVMAILERQTTKDGFEMQFGTNHLGHFLLTHLLIDALKKAAPSRIINLSSLAHTNGKMNWDDLMGEKSYGALPAYGQSKLANILFTKKLAQLYEKDQIKSVCLHPGVIRTELTRYIINNPVKKALFALTTPAWWFITRNVAQGAQTTLYCALADYDKLTNGGYYNNCELAKESKLAKKAEDADRLWTESFKLLKLDAGSK